MSVYFTEKRIIQKLSDRIPGAILSVLISALILCGTYYNSNLSYIGKWHSEFGNMYKPSDLSNARGIIYCFLKSIPSAFPTAPDGYDKSSVQSAISKYKTTPIADDKKVHIISIMLEAYNDFSQFPGVQFNRTPYKNYHALKKDSYSGKLFTNSFAGNTILTERAFLTGMGGADFSKKTLSHVWYFKENGYYTEAMHPYHGWFYNRKDVNARLGFDNFYNFENKYSQIPDDMLTEEKYLDFLSDADFFESIKEGLEAAVERGDKYFNFSVTYQNHGPYEDEVAPPYNYITNKTDEHISEYNIINNYFSGIDRTDAALGRLHKYIDSQKEPIVLIIFGDHNPYLGSDNIGYELLGIDIDTETPQGCESYYSTPYLFHANTAAKKALGVSFIGEGSTISPVFLMNELFEYAGIGSSYYGAYLSEIKKDTDVLNPVYIKQNGEYIQRGKTIESPVLTQRQHIEYYLKNDAPTHLP